jgi:flagellar export protein FliJ
MTRSYRLQRIIDIASTVERIAASALAESNNEVTRCAEQLERLRAYRAEYERPLSAGDEPMNAQTLQEYHLFVSRLNDLIDTLETKLERLTHARDDHRQHWLKQRKRNDVLHDIHGRAVGVENRIRDARAEREIDDQSAAKAMRH